MVLCLQHVQPHADQTAAVGCENFSEVLQAAAAVAVSRLAYEVICTSLTDTGGSPRTPAPSEAYSPLTCSGAAAEDDEPLRGSAARLHIPEAHLPDTPLLARHGEAGHAGPGCHQPRPDATAK